MITKKAAQERGATRTDWLESYHTFSFGQYYDPAYMGFSDLRVINDDRVIAGAGFGTHGHKDMEIITYVLSGALSHRDSMGNGSTLRHGDVQIMSAGSGVTHSEFNASNTEAVHFLQMWIVPNKQSVTPRYQEKSFDAVLQQEGFHEVVNFCDTNEALHIHQEARLLIGRIKAGEQQYLSFNPKRKAWVHIATGAVAFNNHTAQAGDGFAVELETLLNFDALCDSEVLIFDLTDKGV